MIAPIEQGKADAVVGRVMLAPHLIKPWMTRRHRQWLAELDFSDDQIALSTPVDLVGANMGYSRKVLDVVPEYDAELGGGARGFGDETLFSWQLLRAGFVIAPVPESVVEHHFEASRATAAIFREDAVKRGRCEAYIAHHWRHQRFRGIPFRLAMAKIGVALARIGSMMHGDVPGDTELLTRMHAAFLEQLMSERRKPRRYERYAPIKIQCRNGENRESIGAPATTS
jgi:hypothetical protein